MTTTTSLCEKQIKEIKALFNDDTTALDERVKLLVELINSGTLEQKAQVLAHEAYLAMTYKKGDATYEVEEESLEY